jgi:quercetin dioxygenase-like cupin family protein
VKLLPTDGPAPRPERPATQLHHDEENARVVAFCLLKGQQVAPHHSESTVIVQVLEGEGVFRGEESEARLRVFGCVTGKLLPLMV